ncbi:MAG TPA: TatD family hydrolase [Candidatus Diapherotrites archaeon]|uniref:TatD family hydrolase n=1 Tax=Candidatus Iainarchaeum sp. TaxID=3101447 RepID=A0A7J4IWM4_9ARCH|nr:TatD family hydrolase [Candidatus Diapherotrites archaeon]
MLADSHCHLDSFPSPQAVIGTAVSAGVGVMVSNSTNLASMEKNIFLASRYKQVRCALGLHPVDLLFMERERAQGCIAYLKANIPHAKSIGEVGLDFKYAANDMQRSIQENFFTEQVEIALENGLPLIVHSRYAEKRCLEILARLGAERVLMHWLTGNKKSAEDAVSLGYFISCGPVILNDPASAQVVKSIPLENILLETDAPVKFGGKPSDPSWVKGVCAKVGGLKGLDYSNVEAATWSNFKRLFRE